MNVLVVVGIVAYIASWGYLGYRIGRWAVSRRREREAVILWMYEHPFGYPTVSYPTVK